MAKHESKLPTILIGKSRAKPSTTGDPLLWPVRGDLA